MSVIPKPTKTIAIIVFLFFKTGGLEESGVDDGSENVSVDPKTSPDAVESKSSEFSIGSGVKVGVGVGVLVGSGLGVFVGAGVGVFVEVGIGVGVDVFAGSGVRVGVGVAVGKT